MTLVEIAIGTVLRIPDGWDSFVYRGYLYRRMLKQGVEKFRCVGAVEKQSA